MLVQRLSASLKSALAGASNGSSRFVRHEQERPLWPMRHIDIWLPLLLGTMLGVLLTVFVVGGRWQYAVAVALVVPLVILFNKYPFAAIVLWLLLAPFVQVTPDATYRTLYWMVHRAIIPVALVMTVLANLLVRKTSNVKLGRMDLAMLVSMGILLVSVLLNYPNPMPMFYNIYDRFFIPFCVFWLIRFATPGAKDLKWLLPVLFAITIAECVIAMIGWYAPELLPPHWSIYQGARATGSFRAYSSYTIALIFYGLLLFHTALNRKLGLFRSACLFAFGFAVIGVFISFSRGSWLAGGAVMAALLLVYPKATVRIIIIVSAVVLILGNSVMAEQVAWATERLSQEDTALDRLVVFHTAWQMVKAKPFFGWGYETYDRYDRQFQGRVANHVITKDLTSHNTYLTVLAERGVIGFLFYFFPFFWLLWQSFRAWPHMPKDGFWSRKLLMVFWLMILFQIIVSNFTDTKRDPFVFTMWWLELGFIANMVQAHLEPADVGLPAWKHGIAKIT